MSFLLFQTLPLLEWPIISGVPEDFTIESSLLSRIISVEIPLILPSYPKDSPILPSHRTGWHLQTVHRSDHTRPGSWQKRWTIARVPPSVLLCRAPKATLEAIHARWWGYKEMLHLRQTSHEQKIELYCISQDFRSCLLWHLALVTLTNSIWEMCKKS